MWELRVEHQAVAPSSQPAGPPVAIGGDMGGPESSAILMVEVSLFPRNENRSLSQ
jgi:hypothetical protein